MSDRKRRGLGRGIAVLAIVAMGAMAVTPALSAFKPTRAKIKKIARNVARTQATDVLKSQIGPVGNPLFIQETELIRYGPVKLNMSDAQVTIGTFGPFTLKAECLDQPSEGTHIQPRVSVTTAEPDSMVNAAYGGSNHDLDPGGEANWWMTGTADSPGEPPELETYGDNESVIVAPSGAYLVGITEIATNFAGSDCWIRGVLTFDS